MTRTVLPAGSDAVWTLGSKNAGQEIVTLTLVSWSDVNSTPKMLCESPMVSISSDDLCSLLSSFVGRTAAVATTNEGNSWLSQPAIGVNSALAAVAEKQTVQPRIKAEKFLQTW